MNKIIKSFIFSIIFFGVWYFAKFLNNLSENGSVFLKPVIPIFFLAGIGFLIYGVYLLFKK